MSTVADIRTLCPKDEQVWVVYYNKAGELCFFLSSPARSSSTAAAQDDSFTLYAIVAGGKGSHKAKKLGQGGNPTELEVKYGVAAKMME